MAIVDANQDPACLAANACLKNYAKNKLSPESRLGDYMLQLNHPLMNQKQ